MMFAGLAGLALAVALMLAGWCISLVRNNVDHVDALWGPTVAGSGVMALLLQGPSPRGVLVVALACLWALRLSAHVLYRNHGHHPRGEDRRYAEIRQRNEPGFRMKSLYLVFGLQAILAWLVGLPLYGAVTDGGDLWLADALGCAIFAFGWVFESVADWQLLRFRAAQRATQRAGGAERAADSGVMDRGLWRYSRHPNYFGEVCLWWGLWLIAAAGGAGWTVIGPALLTFLILKVSGVALTEKDIATRRPEYRAYIRRTSAFVPRPPSA